MTRALPLGLLLGCAFLAVGDESKKRSIHDIMLQAHLKPQNRSSRNNLDNKVIDGKATDAEKQRLLELYQQLAKAKPPKGDLEMWKRRTTELVDATESLIRGEDKNAERFLKARNCKGCHADHRK